MNSKKILTIFLGMVLVIALGILLVKGFSNEDNWICQKGEWVKHGKPSGPMPTGVCKDGQQAAPQKEEEKSEIPNPASQNCVDKGGKLETVKETAGEIGVCKFNDGTRCEEWKFFRDECKQGQAKKADLSHSYFGKISKTTKGYSLNSNGVLYELKLVEGASKELANRLKTEAEGKEEVTIIASEEPLLSKILILKSFQEK